MRILRKLGARSAAAAVALSVLSVGAYAAADDAGDGDQAQRVQVPASWQGPVDYLTAKYGLTSRQAVQRMDMQDEAPEIRELIERRQPDAFAGLWLDMNDGAIHVRSTQPEQARRALAVNAAPAGKRLVIDEAAVGLRDLERQAERMEKTAGSSVRVAVSERTGAIQVVRPDTEAGRRAADKARRSAPPRVDVNVSAAPQPGTEANTPAPPSADKPDAKAPPPLGRCGPLNCDPPLHSGVRLDAARDKKPEKHPYGGCTLGYVLHEKGKNRPYLLTAGHCFYSLKEDAKGSHHRLKESVWHNGIRVGREGTEYGSYGHSKEADHEGKDRHPFWDDQTWDTPDYAIIPVANKDYWFGDGQRRPGLMAHYGKCGPKRDKTPNGYDCEQAGTTKVTGKKPDPDIGSVVCQQGTGEAGDTGTGAPKGWVPGERCGEVTYSENEDELVRVNDLCTAPGDSGGPLYQAEKNGNVTAIGVLTDGSPAKTGYEKCELSGDEGEDKVQSWYWTIDYLLGHEKSSHSKKDFRLYTR